MQTMSKFMGVVGTRSVCNEARPILMLRYRRLCYMLAYLVSGQLA